MPRALHNSLPNSVNCLLVLYHQQVLWCGRGSRSLTISKARRPTLYASSCKNDISRTGLYRLRREINPTNLFCCKYSQEPRAHILADSRPPAWCLGCVKALIDPRREDEAAISQTGGNRQSTVPPSIAPGHDGGPKPPSSSRWCPHVDELAEGHTSMLHAARCTGQCCYSSAV